MLTALVLICSLANAPDQAACTRDTAVHVMLVPIEFGNPATCFMHAQAYVAETTIGQELMENEWVKVVCVPSRSVATLRLPTAR